MSLKNLSPVLTETVEVIEHAGGPGTPVTTSDVAAELDVGRRSTYNRLERLVDHGVLETKAVGSKGRVWWRPPDEDTQEAADSTGELQRERRFVEGMIEAIPMLIGVFDAETHGLLRANRRLESFLGVERDSDDGYDYTGGDLPLYDASGDPIPSSDRPFHMALERGEPVHDWEARMENARGERRWYSISAEPLSRDDETNRVVVVADDVTRLKLQAQRLERERDELVSDLEDVYTRIHDGYVELDEELRVVSVNDRATEILGFSEIELLGMPIREQFDAGAETAETFDAVLRTGDPATVETRVEPPGSWFHAHVYPSETGLAVYFRDVTERVQREQTLRQFRTLADAIPDAVVTIDPDSEITYANPAVADVFGYRPEALVGEPLTRLIPDDLVDANLDAFQRFLATGERRIDWESIELPGLHRDGHTVPISVSFSEFEHDDQQLFTGVVRDITDRKERERSLEHRLDQQAVVADLGQQALEALDLDTLLAEAAEVVADTLAAGFCKMWDLDPEADELLLRQGVGWPDGVVGSATVSAVDNESLASHTLLTDEPVVVTDLRTEERFSGPALLTDNDIRSGISVLIGTPEEPWGILGVHDAEPGEFSDTETMFVQSIANILASAIDRHDHEQQLLRHREQLTALNNLNEVVRDVTEGVIEESTREEIEATVCERLAASDSYGAAWIGELDIRSGTVTSRTAAGAVAPSAGAQDDDVVSGPAAQAVSDGELQIARVGQGADDAWRARLQEVGYRTAAAIPIEHDVTPYGVLTLLTDRPNAFADEERAVIEQLGEVIGHAIAAVERKRALTSEEVVELEFTIPDVFSSVGVPRLSGASVSFDRTVPVDENLFLEYGTATADGIDGLRAAAASPELPSWESVRVLDDGGEQTRFELRLNDPPVLSIVVDHGGYVAEVNLKDGDYAIQAHLSPSADVRQVVEAIKAAYPSINLVAQRQVTRDRQSPARLGEGFHEAITERQRTAVETAFHAGFFEWPRESSGEDIAASLDVCPSTFHQHLRAAERELMSLVVANGRPGE